MATLYVREYAYLPRDENGEVILVGWEPAVTGQSVTFTTSAQSSAFNAKTRFVRVWADADCFIDFGANPTAAKADGLPLTAKVAEFFGVAPGQKVAAYDGTS